MLQHVKTIGTYFLGGGVLPESMLSCRLCKQLTDILEMNSMTSDDLMLMYYQSLAGDKQVSKFSSSRQTGAKRHTCRIR